VGVSSEIAGALARANEIFSRQSARRQRGGGAAGGEDPFSAPAWGAEDADPDPGEPPESPPGSAAAAAAATATATAKEMSDSPSASAEGDRRSKKKKSKTKKLKMLWQEITDHDSGQCYYYNRTTRETTWDKPSAEQLDIVYTKEDD
jgi:hypothetical protein